MAIELTSSFFTNDLNNTEKFVFHKQISKLTKNVFDNIGDTVSYISISSATPNANIENGVFDSCIILDQLFLPNVETYSSQLVLNPTINEDEYGVGVIGTVSFSEGTKEILGSTFTSNNGAKLSVSTIEVASSVSSIGDNFSTGLDKDVLEGVNFKSPANISSIGKSAFEDCNMYYFYIGNTVLSVDDNAFKNFKKYNYGVNVNVENVKYVGNSAFENCDAIEATYNFNLKQLDSIGNNAFLSCDIKKATIVATNKLTSFPSTVFEYNDIEHLDITAPSLTSISFCDSVCSSLVTFTGSFANIINLPELTSVNSGYDKSNVRTVTFNDCNLITTVNKQQYANLESFILNTTSNNEINIEQEAFCNSLNLKNVDIPISNITSIGVSAFAGTAIFEFELPTHEKYIKLEDGLFENCIKLESITIPENVKEFGNNVFKNCSNSWFDHIDVANITSFGSGVFEGCSSLTSIVLNDSLTSFSENMFNGCTDLENITYPSNLKNIGNNALLNTIITDYRIPSEITSVGNMFDNENIKNIAEYITIPRELDVSKLSEIVGLTPINNFKSLQYINIECENIDEIINSDFGTNENTSIDEILFPNNVNLKISDGVLTNLKGLTKISRFPCINNLDPIGLQLLTGVESLIVSPRPDNDTSTLGDIFNNTNLKSFSLPDGDIKTITGHFTNCPKLLDINLKEVGTSELTTINSTSPFIQNCQSLTAISLPKTLTSFDGILIDNCQSLAELDILITSNIDILPETFITNCPSITSITLPNGLTSFNGNTFGYNTAMESLTIPNTVVSLENISKNFTNLNTLYLNSNQVTSFGNSCLSVRDGGSKIHIVNDTFSFEYDSGTIIFGDNSFENTSGLTKLIFDKDCILKIGNNAFKKSINLKDFIVRFEELTDENISFGTTIFSGSVNFDRISFENIRLNDFAKRFNVNGGSFGTFTKSDSEKIYNSLCQLYFGNEPNDTITYVFKDCSVTKYDISFQNGIIKITPEGRLEYIHTFDSSIHTDEEKDVYDNIINNSNTVFIESYRFNSMNDSAIQSTVKLSTMVLPNGITSIGNNAFGDMPTLTGLSIDSPINDTLDNVGLKYLTSLSIGSDYQYTLMENHFSGIENLKDLKIDSINLYSISENAFNGTKISNLTINSLREIYLNEQLYTLSVRPNAFHNSDIKEMCFPRLGSSYFKDRDHNEECALDFKYDEDITIDDQTVDCYKTNRTGLNIWTRIWTNEHPPLAHPQFVVTPRHIYDYKVSGKNVSRAIKSNDGTWSDTQVKFIEKAFTVDEYGYVSESHNNMLHYGGIIPDNALYGFAGIRTDAFKKFEDLQRIVIPQDILPFNGIEPSFIIEKDGLKMNETSTTEIHIPWITVDEFYSSSILSNCVNEWGISNCVEVTIKLIDGEIYYDNTYRRYTNPFRIKIHQDGKMELIKFYQDAYLNDGDMDDSVVTIPQNVISIGVDAFSEVTEESISAVNLNDVQYIKDGAFYNSNPIKTIYNLENVKYIGNDSFYGTSIDEFNLNDDITFIGKNAFAYTQIENIDLSKTKSIHEIDNFGFGTCPKLTEVKIGTNISSILDEAFFTSKTFKKITGNASNIRHIGQNSFNSNDTYTKILDTIESNNGIKLSSIDTLAFANTNLSSSHFILNGISSIGEGSFQNSDIYGITIEAVDGIDNLVIEKNAFNNSGLCSFEFGTQEMKLMDYSFANLKYPVELSIGSNVNYLGSRVFEMYPGETISVHTDLSTLSTLNEVISSGNIVNNSFENIFGLSSRSYLLMTNGNDAIYQNFAYAFGDKMYFCPSYLCIDPSYPAKIVNISRSERFVVLPDYILSVDAIHLSGNTILQQLAVPSTISVGEYAFMGCSALNSYVYSDKDFDKSLLSTLYTGQFYGCKSIENLRLDKDTISSIPPYTFFECESLKTDVKSEFTQIGNNIISVEDCAFAGCKSLSSLNFSDKLTYLGENVVSGCDMMTKIYINQDYVTFIDNFGDESMLPATYEKYNLADKIGDTISALNIIFDAHFNNTDRFIVQLSNDLFDSQTGEPYSNDIVVNDDNVITACYSSRVTVSDVLYTKFTGIDDYVFTEAEFLKSLIQVNPEELSGNIGNYAFYNCRNLITLNNSMNELSCTNVGEYAFLNCEKFVFVRFDANNMDSIGENAFLGSGMNHIIMDCSTMDDISEAEDRVKDIFGWSEENKNPLSLNSNCVIEIVYNGDNVIKYDYTLTDISHQYIEVNRHHMVYIDKTINSVKAILVVPSNDKSGLVENTFNAHIIGRWK